MTQLRTGGVLLDVTGQDTALTGNWFQVDALPEQVLLQITMSGNGTVAVQGRIGPGHSVVELASVTDADFDGLVNRFSQMRVDVSSIGATPPDVLVSVVAETYDTGA